MLHCLCSGFSGTNEITATTQPVNRLIAPHCLLVCCLPLFSPTDSFIPFSSKIKIQKCSSLKIPRQNAATKNLMTRTSSLVGNQPYSSVLLDGKCLSRFMHNVCVCSSPFTLLSPFYSSFTHLSISRRVPPTRVPLKVSSCSKVLFL